MGTMFVVYGTIDFETPEALTRWMARPVPDEVPEGPPLLGETGGTGSI